MAELRHLRIVQRLIRRLKVGAGIRQAFVEPQA
jgi:hypothetical protein